MFLPSPHVPTWGGRGTDLDSHDSFRVHVRPGGLADSGGGDVLERSPSVAWLVQGKAMPGELKQTIRPGLDPLQVKQPTPRHEPPRLLDLFIKKSARVDLVDLLQDRP